MMHLVFFLIYMYLAIRHFVSLPRVLPSDTINIFEIKLRRKKQSCSQRCPFHPFISMLAYIAVAEILESLFHLDHCVIIRANEHK